MLHEMKALVKDGAPFLSDAPAVDNDGIGFHLYRNGRRFISVLLRRRQRLARTEEQYAGGSGTPVQREMEESESQPFRKQARMQPLGILQSFRRDLKDNLLCFLFDVLPPEYRRQIIVQPDAGLFAAMAVNAEITVVRSEIIRAVPD